MLSRKLYDVGVKDFSAVDRVIGNPFTHARTSQIFIGKDCVVHKMSAVQNIMDFLAVIHILIH
jgi:hypothetical protein